MRNKIVAGNWKMNTSLSEGVNLAKDIKELVIKLNKDPHIKIVLGVPYTHINSVYELIKKTEIELAAQDCSLHESGAFTGEISANMIKSSGASYCIIGHSERRHYHKETDKIIADKIKTALKENLIPIFCCGETIEIRENLQHFSLVNSQIENALFNLSEDEFGKIIIAYEPVWAIGTGLTASPQQAQEMHLNIRNLVINKYGEDIADSLSILYGGSCKPSNAKELFSKPDVDGGLIGGASLKANDFIEIIKAI
jgi:triosephosphate isomerase (TIM)